MAKESSSDDTLFMRRALHLAARGRGRTAPNPCVGAVLVRDGQIIGEGWHRRAGEAHAEVNALRDAERRGEPVKGATIYVTLEPCSTTGRTPPCTEAIRKAGIRRVVVAAVDPNPLHAGKGLELLRRRQISVSSGLLAKESNRLNEAFNHWIVTRRPFVTVKAAMTLDGRIATAAGESKWITGPESARQAMRLRKDADAILVGVNTILVDDPSLTCRAARDSDKVAKRLRRIVLDSRARTPIAAKVVDDAFAGDSTVVVTAAAPRVRLNRLRQRVDVWVAPEHDGRVDLRWLLDRLGREDVTGLLVEGGGEVNASFIEAALVQRVAFFYAPKILGGAAARRGVAGSGFESLGDLPRIVSPQWRRLGADLFLTGLIAAA